MIKYNNLVPNQESRVGAIQQRKLQALVLWAKDHQSRGLAIIHVAWTAVDIISSVTQINIHSPSVGNIKVAHPGKVETGYNWTIWDFT